MQSTPGMPFRVYLYLYTLTSASASASTSILTSRYDEDDEMLQQGAINDGFTLPPYISKHEKEVRVRVCNRCLSEPEINQMLHCHVCTHGCVEARL